LNPFIDDFGFNLLLSDVSGGPRPLVAGTMAADTEASARHNHSITVGASGERHTSLRVPLPRCALLGNAVKEDHEGTGAALGESWWRGIADATWQVVDPWSAPTVKGGAIGGRLRVGGIGARGSGGSGGGVGSGRRERLGEGAESEKDRR
jgi:hypothetical protein